MRILLILLLLISHGSLAADKILQRLHHPVPGGVALIELGYSSKPPAAYYQNKPVLVSQEESRNWVALVGIPLQSQTGIHHLEVVGRGKIPFRVGSKHYREQHIKLANRRQVNPNPADLIRIQKELAEQNRIYRIFSPNPPASLRFDKPVPGALSSPFGLRRFFNGEERNPHSGLDFVASSGTPVRLPTAGKVLLIADYFFNGKTVFIDHGQGVISMFCHLSRIDVKQGQKLARGKSIGLVGRSGRATGPHLHWNLSLNDTRIDPAIFIGAFKP